MNSQNRVVAINGAENPLTRAVAAAFGETGAIVERVSDASTLGALSRSHVNLDTLILMVPALQPRETTALEHSAWAQALNGLLAPSIQLIQAAGAHMVERRGGCILIVGGIAGTAGFPGWAQTSMVEGALIALIRSLGCEWAPSNVRVVYLACSMPEATGVAPSVWAARTPLGRNAQPNEIAKVALYLASENASFTTGSVVRADGGWTAWGLLK